MNTILHQLLDATLDKTKFINKIFTSQIIAQKINRIALPIKKHKLKFKNVYTYRIPYNLQNGNTLLVTCNI